MPRTRADLMAFLDGLGIQTKTVDHPPLYTVEQSQALRGEIAGAHTKNLFVKDKKGRYFLLTVGEEAEVDLKTVHQLIGASGRVSFGKPDALMELLGVQPGAVTALGVINDTSGLVTLVLDAGLMQNEIVNCHPLTNEATTSIASNDLVRFAEATGHAPLVLNLATA
ncbi:prolyl-tRNA synthetase associated domain-containing protein [Aquibium carbonis]|uniref:Prolyl-tRNA synthetase associated domain-containing protein n=1 Tax=Aquibium carbonis TaxID=2495581 RepID=A0A3R9YHY9_9HYPH|nr:prolyl-tRNA synthetase associated domain-containing protein [Aquibium carbonis]RST88150.1 prolyl-tRNA synthetase associated domain-containing protein [Aquibium carbonis]